ncbi:MAG: Crp/Fnr family transcriptional regulator [Hyphomicrobium sp.]|nr:Crp/Fnr family transcriptional regulator [Hyphomicrobium sp.]
MELFPRLGTLENEHLRIATQSLITKRLYEGEMAYTQGADCHAYVMCLEGRTRTYKGSSSGREIMLYRVGPGETCVLTTSCLLARRGFPAESVAEAPTLLAALPAPVFQELMGTSRAFRDLVLDNYGEAMASLITLVDEVAFARLDLRLARRLISTSNASDVIEATHQQLALDLGSVREVITRYLREWERAGWIRNSRGTIEVVDRSALERYAASN